MSTMSHSNLNLNHAPRSPAETDPAEQCSSVSFAIEHRRGHPHLRVFLRPPGRHRGAARVA